MRHCRIQSGRDPGDEAVSASIRHEHVRLKQQPAQAGELGHATASGDEQESEVCGAECRKQGQAIAQRLGKFRRQYLPTMSCDLTCPLADNERSLAHKPQHLQLCSCIAFDSYTRFILTSRHLQTSYARAYGRRVRSADRQDRHDKLLRDLE